MSLESIEAALGTYHLTYNCPIEQAVRNNRAGHDFRTEWTKEDEIDAAIQLQAFYAKRNLNYDKT